MSRAWRIYFGAVATVFVVLTGLAYRARAEERRPTLDPQAMAEESVGGGGWSKVRAVNARPGLQLDLSRLKASPPPAVGDYPEIR